MIFTQLIEWMYLHYRKVEDLQFQIEEESMMKDDLEVGNISYLYAHNVCVIWFYLNLNKMGETKYKWRRLDKIQIWHIFTRILTKVTLVLLFVQELLIFLNHMSWPLFFFLWYSIFCFVFSFGHCIVCVCPFSIYGFWLLCLPFEWVRSDCYLTPNQQFFSYIVMRS